MTAVTAASFDTYGSVNVSRSVAPRRRRPAWLAWGAALAPVAVLGAAFVGALAGGDYGNATAPLPGQRQALLTFAAQFTPLAREGGQVVQLGMKGSIDDIREHLQTDAELADAAQGWARDLTRVKAGVAALDPPPFLRPAHAVYLHALDGYIAAAHVLLAATQTQGQLRAELVDVAIGIGEHTDDVYEQARGLVNRQRARLGVPLDTLPGE
jgi:hypothetical protein